MPFMLRNVITPAALAAALFCAGAAQAQTPECSLENVASAEEVKAGWTLKTELKTIDQQDSAPFQEGAAGNWFITRTSTRNHNCSAHDDMGNYSLRSYMLPKIVTTQKIQICQATANGGSEKAPPPPGVTPQPADTEYVGYSSFDRPYAGSCPPLSK